MFRGNKEEHLKRSILMKKTIIGIIAILLVTSLLGCEEWSRGFKDFSSSLSGLDRVATVYSADGEFLRTYEGRFDVEVNEYGNKVKFDINGKRVLIYNATVIIEEQ